MLHEGVPQVPRIQIKSYGTANNYYRSYVPACNTKTSGFIHKSGTHLLDTPNQTYNIQCFTHRWERRRNRSIEIRDGRNEEDIK